MSRVEDDCEWVRPAGMVCVQAPSGATACRRDTFHCRSHWSLLLSEVFESVCVLCAQAANAATIWQLPLRGLQ